MACFSTSLGVLNAFIHPVHSHKNGNAGFNLGILVTLSDDDVPAVVSDIISEPVVLTGPGDIELDELEEPVGDVNATLTALTVAMFSSGLTGSLDPLICCKPPFKIGREF
jgi:hypothetical protein